MSVNNYVAVSESGNPRERLGFRSLQIMGVRCGFRGTNVSLCVSVVPLKNDTLSFLTVFFPSAEKSRLCQ